MERAKALNDQDGKHSGWAVNCPGCGYWHLFDARWWFNGNVESPSFQPSMLVNATIDRVKYPNCHRCHSYVTNGKIQFLADCSHALAGQTVELGDANE